jgi:hypothetical protein
MAFGPAIFDRDVLTFEIARFGQALPERGKDRRGLSRGTCTEKPNHRCRKLLCSRRKRPNCRAAQARNKIPPSHLSFLKGPRQSKAKLSTLQWPWEGCL